MSYKILISPLLLISTLITNCQTNVDPLVKELNKFCKENRLSKGKIHEIFVNKTSKTIDIEDYIIQLNNYTANYEGVHDKNKIVNTVRFECLGESDCMYNSNDKEKQNDTGFKRSGFGIAFISKKACYEFINLVDEIKQLVLSYQ